MVSTAFPFAYCIFFSIRLYFILVIDWYPDILPKDTLLKTEMLFRQNVWELGL
jgi:hypothetical protein